MFLSNSKQFGTKQSNDFYYEVGRDWKIKARQIKIRRNRKLSRELKSRHPNI